MPDQPTDRQPILGGESYKPETVSRAQLAQLVQELLERPIAYHRIFARIGGGATAGLMLSQAWYWSKRATIAGKWFYKSAREWEEETGLTRREQETARRKLVERKLIEEDLRGVPATLHFRVNGDVLFASLLEALNPQDSEKPDQQTSLAETCKLEDAKRANQFGGNVETISETTPETTPETTHTHLRAVGAPVEGVCVSGKFPLRTYERYARNQTPQLGNGWISKARKTGEWDEQVAFWCAEHAIDPRTGENVGTPGEEASLAATPYGQPQSVERKCTPECPRCFGSGMESVPGKGARRCPNRTAQAVA